jgi:hypothetical protein
MLFFDTDIDVSGLENREYGRGDPLRWRSLFVCFDIDVSVFVLNCCMFHFSHVKLARKRFVMKLFSTLLCRCSYTLFKERRDTNQEVSSILLHWHKEYTNTQHTTDRVTQSINTAKQQKNIGQNTT